MLAISILIIIFGAFGTGFSLYLRFTVKSPIASLQPDGDAGTQGLTIQQILNLAFVYFAILHVIIALIGVNFLLGMM